MAYEFDAPDGSIQHEYDFVAYYLNGDCDGDEEITLTIEKKA